MAPRENVQVTAKHTGEGSHANDGWSGGAQLTSRVSSRGRQIYIYLDPCDRLDYRDAPEGEPSRMRVEVAEDGSRRWEVQLAAGDALETGRPQPPPPPPPPGGEG